MLRTTLTLLAGLICSSAAVAGPVNINTATAEELQAELFGIGPVLAQRIVVEREQNGPYASAEDMTRVHLIGQRTIANNAGWILVE